MGKAEIPCALCGSIEHHRFIGRAGCACVNCLGEAARQMLVREHPRNPPALTASTRCLLCGDSVAKSTMAATRGPYAICQECVIDAFTRATDDAGYVEVAF